MKDFLLYSAKAKQKLFLEAKLNRKNKKFISIIFGGNASLTEKAEKEYTQLNENDLFEFAIVVTNRLDFIIIGRDEDYQSIDDIDNISDILYFGEKIKRGD